MIAVNFGAVLGLLGWPVLQTLGLANEPATEIVQRKQADSISQLDTTVQALNAAIVDLSTRADIAGDRLETTSQRMAEFDSAFRILRTSLNEMHTARVAANESWREPVAELTTAAARARSEIIRLRASVDELGLLRQPEASAISARIDRVEQAMAQHNLLGQIRGSIHESRLRPRSLAARENSSLANGHILNLKPAQ